MSLPVDPAERRARLLCVLALPADANAEQMRAASERLLRWLEARRARLEGASDDAGRAALDQEIAELAAETARFAPALAGWARDPTTRPTAPPTTAPDTLPAPSQRPRSTAITPRRGAGAPFGQALGDTLRRNGAALAVVGGVVLLALLVAHAAGFRITRAAPAEPPPLYAARAQLRLEGELADATLRILDADRTELLEKLPAQGARVELEPGRYALEVARADCPDAWTRSVFLEPGRVHRYEPALCVGQGSLVVRANTRGDRLRIDERDVGESGERVHRLAVGQHRVRIDKPGYRPYEANVQILADQSLELSAELVALGESPPAVVHPLPVQRVTPSVSPADMKALQEFTTRNLKSELKTEPIAPADLGLPRRGDFLAREGLPAMPDGGSTAWHDRVAEQLRERFDTDRSGEIDSLAESEPIPCTVLREIERDFERGGLGLSLAHYYGFDGSEWHPGALAVARGIRSAVYAKMRECGLDP